MAEAIRIDDLAAPRLTELQRAAIELAPPVELTVDTVLGKARAATGLSDFGPPDFRERLALWLESVAEDDGLGPLGRATMVGECVRYASTRLRFEEFAKDHPTLDAVVIDRPVMVAGLPRSGTTHLVNLLAADPRFRSTPLWEAMEPIPTPGEDAAARAAGAPDPRFVRTEAMWGAFETILPLMPAMHEMAPDHVHEDIELQGPDFSSYLPEWLCRATRWRDHYLAHDQTPHYAYARRMMQALTLIHGPERWLVKSPPHMENLPALIAVHPTAIVPVTHRDPVAVIQSAITMIAYGDRIRRRTIDLPELARTWIDRIEVLLRRCARDRDVIPSGQSIDILFHEYMADQKATIARVYALAGLELPGAAEARVDAFLAANPRGRHGRIAYDLIGDFGVDIGALRERFQFYYDRFPVERERVAGGARMNDVSAERLLSGRAWDDYCEQVRRAGRLVDRFGDDVDALDQAEWYRFVTRLMRNGFERFVENCEPPRPRLRDTPWRQSINFQSPDQDHLLAEFVDGRHDYRISGNRGTIPYFVIASWTAPQPGDIGARDWAERGVEGLGEFDPTALTTTGFIQSDSIRFDADGGFVVIVSHERPPGDADWLPITDGCVGLLVRTLYHLREETIAPTMRIERIDRAPVVPITPADMADALAKAGQVVLGYAELVRRWWQDNLVQRPNRIRFSRAVYLSNGGVPDRHHGFGTWACAPDEALVIRFTPVECDYWIFQLCNIWQENLDNYEDGGGHVQKHRARLEGDASVLIVIAAHDPGIGGNVIDPAGHAHGGMSLRFIKTAGDPPPVVLHRVPLALLAERGTAALDPASAIVSGEITD